MPIILLQNIIVCLCVVVLSDHCSIIAVKYSRKFSQYSEKTPTLPERLFKNVDGLCYETFSEFGLHLQLADLSKLSTLCVCVLAAIYLV